MSHTVVENTPTSYIAAGALGDPRIMEALLGTLPNSHRFELNGFAVGIVTGNGINAQSRFNVVPEEYLTRVLVQSTGESTTARMYSGLTPEQLRLVGIFANEGTVSQAVLFPIGGHEIVGEAHMHCVRKGLPFEIIPVENQELFPNGFEATLLAAHETRQRYIESFHGPSPERR